MHILQKTLAQTQLKAPYTAQQLSQAAMNFDGLQLDHQFPCRSRMPEQLNFISLPRSPSLNAHASAPLASNVPLAHINVPTLSSLVLSPKPPHFPLIPQALRFAPSRPQAFSLQANNPVTDNVNPFSFSLPAHFISSANIFVPQLIHPPLPQKVYQLQNVVPITHAAPALPDPSVWRLPAAVPSNALPVVCKSVDLKTVKPAPLSNPYVPTSLRSSFHVQAASGFQNYVTLDFMQTNPFRYCTGIAPLLSLRSFRQRMERPFRTRFVGVANRIQHLRLLLWTPRIW